MTIHSGEEHTIWEGESQNVTAKATGGRFTLHYRLTTHYLYFETGGITGTKLEQVPSSTSRTSTSPSHWSRKPARSGT